MHGWPGVRGAELERLAYRIAHRDKPGKYGWPQVDRIDYTHLQYGRPAIAVHPYDDGVHIAGATALDDLRGVARLRRAHARGEVPTRQIASTLGRGRLRTGLVDDPPVG